MANKLLKHFGFSGKKVSSQPSPSHEYSAKSSGSIQELHSRGQTKTRSSTSGSSAACTVHGRTDADGRRHSDASAHRGSLPGARGAASRSRTGGGPGSAVVGWSLSRNATTRDDRGPPRGDSATIASSSVRNRRPPRYDSMPRDDRTRSFDHSNSSGSLRLPFSSSSTADNLTPLILDEYSDPFDVKKEIVETVKSASESGTAGGNTDVGNAEALPQAPEDDYSVPYELKNPPPAGETESPKHTDVPPKYDDPYAETPASARSLSAVEDISQHSADTATPPSIVTDIDSSPLHIEEPIGEQTNDLAEPQESSAIAEKTPEVNGDTAAVSVTAGSFGAETDPCATYDEPWDLRAARLGLENRLRAASSSNQALSSMHHQMSAKPDNRARTLDPRPALEYDEPWDRRAGAVQRSLISAKSAKEEARMIREGSAGLSHLATLSSSGATTVGCGGRQQPDASRYLIDRSSPRPVGEFGPCIHTSLSVKHQQHKLCTLNSSSSSNSSVDVDGSVWRPLAERIDPRLPLTQQGWYHGSISRVDAEGLLRVHREGSYLVRMSESNRSDYSLSLKSPQGFMHMKIVSCDDSAGCGGSHYILGQFSQPFDSIPQMIHHYTINKLPIKGAEHMSLLHPVNNELL